MINIGVEKWQELHKKGYNLDMIYLLLLEDKEECKNSIKLLTIYNLCIRKGLITESGEVTLEGKNLLTFLSSSDTVIKKASKQEKEDVFSRWWKEYPPTDTFTIKGVQFKGSRALKVKKEDCKIKLEKILNEGEYTINQLIEALKEEVKQKTELSYKTGVNKMTFMQNSLTYLNQRTFESFIELLKQEPIKPQFDGVNI